MSKLYWGTAWCRAELGHDHDIWLLAKVRPSAWWLLKRLWLFLRIMWRRWDGERIDCRTAWAASEAAVGLGPCEVRRRKRRKGDTNEL